MNLESHRAPLVAGLLLLAGLGTVAYMVRQVMANRTRGREAA